MRAVGWLLLLSGLAGAFLLPPGTPDAQPSPAPMPAPPAPKPAPPAPKKPDEPKKPRRPLLPWREFGATIGGPVSPSGVRLQCELPPERHRHNTASRGLGLCVFTSIHMAADLQNVPQLLEFPKWIRDKGIPGGGYPSKVDDLIKRMCADRGVPAPEYLQVEGDDLEILEKACASGRMPCITYCRSATGRYSGQYIAHMVCGPHALKGEFAILDNNYEGSAGNDRIYEWLGPAEFLQAYAPVDRRSGKRMGWAFILLGPSAPPRPQY